MSAIGYTRNGLMIPQGYDECLVCAVVIPPTGSDNPLTCLL